MRWAALIRLAIGALVLPLMACGDGPMDGSGTALDLDGLVETLRNNGATVQVGGQVSQDFFSLNGRIVTVNGGDVQVFEFRDEGSAIQAAARVSSDGGTIGNVSVLWAAPPHFYRRGRLVALYVGESSAVTVALEAVLGRQFAGR